MQLIKVVIRKGKGNPIDIEGKREFRKLDIFR